MSVQPPDYAGVELDVMRAAFGLAVLYTLEGLRVFAPSGGRSAPVGLARVLDLRRLASRQLLLHRGAQVAVLAYVLDRGTVWALLYLSAFLVLQVTAGSSDGSVNHGNHLVTIVAVAQLAAVFLWNASADRGWDIDDLVARDRNATAAWWSVQAIVAVYFTSGLAKITHSGTSWIQRSPGLLVIATARLDTTGSMGSALHLENARRAKQLIERLLPHPGFARLFFAGGLLVELATPLGLLSEDALAAVGIALLALHYANLRLLSLPFPSYQIIVVGYLVNVPRLWV